MIPDSSHLEALANFIGEPSCLWNSGLWLGDGYWFGEGYDSGFGYGPDRGT